MGNLMKKTQITAKLAAIIPMIILIIIGNVVDVTAQSGRSYPVVAPRTRMQIQEEKEQKSKVVFPDAYSDLDESNPKHKQFKTEEFKNDLEQVRQRYYQALILIQKKDTARAARYFDSAIDKLNQLSGTPGIEDNKDFTDLAQSIIDDYENYVKSIEFLDENSPIFIIREILYKEIDIIEPLDVTAKDASATTAKVSANFPKLPKAPDSLIIPLDDHPTVDKGVQFLTRGQGKKIFTRWLERSSRWFPMMKRIAKEENMPLEIIYLSMIESGLNPTIISSAKALGLWQFMRATGEMYNLNKKGSPFIDERREPEKATRAAMIHLRDLYNEFGDWHLAMAAYNCGAGCVARSIRRTNKQNPNYWEVRDNLPRETRGYVPQYIAAARIAMDPVSYGFDLDSLEFQEEYKYETVSIDSAINLTALAKAAEISVDSLKMFNTELLKECTPPNSTPYQLKLPIGRKALFAANYPKLTDKEKSPFVTHIVGKKEKLSNISKQYNVSVEDIVSINNLTGTKAKLPVGKSLIIPLSSSYLENLAKSTESDSNQKNDNSESVVKLESVKHRVAKGETLFGIARKYEMDVAELRKLNNIDPEGESVISGQELWVKPIPGGNSPATDLSTKDVEPQITKFSKKNQTVKHKVKRGETLAQIADNYGVTIESIQKSNKISKRKHIKSGQVLIISSQGDLVASDKNSKSPNKLTHKVKSGENLSTIAAKYSVTEDELRDWNRQTIKGNTVYANTDLVIYTTIDSKGSTGAKSSAIKNSPKYYKIRRGDTLSEIAAKFGISISSLSSLNKNLVDTKLQVGKQIRIQ